MAEEKDIIERARKLRPVILLAMSGADDKEASKAPEFYPKMQFDGSLINAGTRINWNDKVMKAAVDLWDREDCTPETAPALWEELSYHDGVRIIPETITVTTAFQKEEEGYWEKNEKIYISLVDNNVYTPEQYAPNWRLKEEQNNE